MKCRVCGEIVVCMGGDNHKLEEIENDKEFADWLYYCSTCVDEGSGAFGSIRHWCTDMLGAFSGKPFPQKEFEGALMSVLLEQERAEQDRVT